MPDHEDREARFEIAAARDATLDDGRPTAVARQHGRGHRTARARITVDAW